MENGSEPSTSDDVKNGDVSSISTKAESRKAMNFGFARISKVNKAIARSKIAEQDVEQEIETEEISELEGKQLKNKAGMIISRKDEPLVIPMQQPNNYRLRNLIKLTQGDNDDEQPGTSVQELPAVNGQPDTKPSSIEDEAKLALRREALGMTNELNSLPLPIINGVAKQSKTGKVVDSGTPDQSDETDYDMVPIDQFGLAMLRGMGWKEGDAIGSTFKQVTKLKVPEIRPKGMGLGADKNLVKQVRAMDRGKKSDMLVSGADTKLNVCRGAAVKLHTGLYARIESLDEDNNRCVVRLAVGGNTKSISLFKCTLVTNDEYDKNAKIINLDSYEKCTRPKSDKYRENESESKKHRKEEKKSRKQRSRSRSPDEQKKEIIAKGKPWLYVGMRVRIIDTKSNYYKYKVVVTDVSLGGYQATVETEEGKLLKDMSSAHLETVIPKKPGSLVLLVKQGGLQALLLEVDKRKQTAIVKLLDDEDDTHAEHFDDICEFVV